MTFAEYTEISSKTAAKLGNFQMNTIHYISGVGDELLTELLQLLLSDVPSVNDIMDEASDVCWYISQLYRERNITINEPDSRIFTEAIRRRYGYSDITYSVFNGKSPEVFKSVLKELTMAPGLLQKEIKKEVTGRRNIEDAQIKNVGDFLLSFMKWLAEQFELDFSKHILEHNVDKLQNKRFTKGFDPKEAEEQKDKQA